MLASITATSYSQNSIAPILLIQIILMTSFWMWTWANNSITNPFRGWIDAYTLNFWGTYQRFHYSGIFSGSWPDFGISWSLLSRPAMMLIFWLCSWDPRGVRKSISDIIGVETRKRTNFADNLEKSEHVRCPSKVHKQHSQGREIFTVGWASEDGLKLALDLIICRSRPRN